MKPTKKVIEEFKAKYWTQLIDDYADEHLYDSIVGFIESSITQARIDTAREYGELLNNCYNNIIDDTEIVSRIQDFTDTIIKEEEDNANS